MNAVDQTLRESVAEMTSMLPAGFGASDEIGSMDVGSFKDVLTEPTFYAKFPKVYGKAQSALHNNKANASPEEVKSTEDD